MKRVTLVSARGLVKTHGRGRAARRVLDGADLDVAAGELVAVLGRSGSGKSTLLHLLGALDRPTAGSVAVGGVSFEALDERGLTAMRRSQVGFVFQFFHLIPELTGEENVLLPAGLPGRDGRSRRRGRAVIDSLGLTDVRGALPHEMSGGEQQRFAIARALVNDPPVILADEPTGNLDTASATHVLGLLRTIADEGRAVVLVSHDAGARSIADRVLTLYDGRLQG